jgi:hypothetical protein
VNASRRVVRLRLRTATGARGAMAVAVAGVALALAGCTATNPQQTQYPFDAGEGRSARIGGTDDNSGIKLRNFLVVSNAQGGPGQVVGAISNATGQAADVQLAIVTTTPDGQSQAAGQTVVKVPAGGFVQLGSASSASSATAGATASGADSGGPAGQVASFDLASTPAPPGAVVTMDARTPTIGGTSFEIPVLPATEYYATLLPSGSASQPSTVTPSGSLSPSANPSGAGKQVPSPTGSDTGAASASAS